jgi:hypothetical protein
MLTQTARSVGNKEQTRASINSTVYARGTLWYLLLRPSGGEASSGDSPNLLPRGLHDSEADSMASCVLGFPKSKDCSLFMRDDAISSSSSHLLQPVCSCGKDIEMAAGTVCGETE